MVEREQLLTLTFSHLLFLCCTEQQHVIDTIHLIKDHADLGVGMILNGAGNVPPSSKYVSQSLDLANFHSVSSWLCNIELNHGESERKKISYTIVLWEDNSTNRYDLIWSIHHSNKHVNKYDYRYIAIYAQHQFASKLSEAMILFQTNGIKIN